jgi:hypothetical protein
MEQAKSAPNKEQAGALYKKAWRLYFFGQWPAPTSKGKRWLIKKPWMLISNIRKL